MNYICKKIEDCFADSKTWEYGLPITAEEFLQLLDDAWQKRCNRKLRRPVFIAEGGGIRIKGILTGTTIRVSFCNSSWQPLKKQFELFLDNC